MKNILIIRLSSMGDIIHTFPMVFDIKDNYPDSKIDWLVDENFKDLIKLNKLVSNIIPIPLRKWKKNKLKFLFSLYKWNKELNKVKYDYIIDCQGLLKSSILSKFFIGKVYGFNINSVREKLATLFYNYKYSIEKTNLATIKNRLLAKEIFDYKIDVNKINFGLNSISFSRLNYLVDKNYIVFFHATSKESKKYALNNWIEIANYLIKNYGYHIIVTYGNKTEKKESILIKENANYPENIIVPDDIYNYLELASLISNATFIFGVDTGLIHLSNALDKKLIAIYTDTNPNRTGIIESVNAINLGNKNEIPTIKNVLSNFEKIIGN